MVYFCNLPLCLLSCICFSLYLYINVVLWHRDRNFTYFCCICSLLFTFNGLVFEFCCSCFSCCNCLLFFQQEIWKSNKSIITGLILSRIYLFAVAFLHISRSLLLLHTISFVTRFYLITLVVFTYIRCSVVTRWLT